MRGLLVDSNVILDILTEDQVWFDWSSDQLSEYAEKTSLIINPIIYAEISIRFTSISELEKSVSSDYFTRQALPWEAAFLAGKVFLKYKKNGGNKTAPLPDFFIGAHALVADLTLLTRDKERYKHYFPTLSIVSP